MMRASGFTLTEAYELYRRRQEDLFEVESTLAGDALDAATPPLALSLVDDSDPLPLLLASADR